MPSLQFLRHLPRPTATLTVGEVVGPCIYIWRRGTTVLYVGQTKLGAERACRADRFSGKFLSSDTIEIYPRPGATQYELLTEEGRLIKTLRPLWNVTDMAVHMAGLRRQAEEEPVYRGIATFRQEVAARPDLREPLTIELLARFGRCNQIIQAFLNNFNEENSEVKPCPSFRSA